MKHATEGLSLKAKLEKTVPKVSITFKENQYLAVSIILLTIFKLFSINFQGYEKHLDGIIQAGKKCVMQ